MTSQNISQYKIEVKEVKIKKLSILEKPNIVGKNSEKIKN
jgi:hypothetical protein